MLSFIHLSDIHFRTFSGDPFDIDENLRSELIYDISHNLTKEISSIDGILVCGDIAFSGQAIEYKVAIEFLERICDLLKIEKSHIFCVPGNHDVDQNITRSSASVKALQDKLEQTKNSTEFDWQLSEMFRNTQDSSVLYSPITCYNEKFATMYGCSLAPNRPIWKQEMDFEGNYKLCIVGINSTIISNHEDHRDNGGEKLMRIGEIQIPSRKENTIFLSLCHHPPECWEDPERRLALKINNRIAIQLYGHKHEQAIECYKNALLIKSGATHPSRFEEGWIPRYNWICLKIDKVDSCDVLTVRIYPRVLDKTSSKFEPDTSIPDGKEYIEYSLPLSECMNLDNATPPEVMPEQSVLSVSSWERSFIYDFMSLPFLCRERILKKFALEKPKDEGKKHTELLEEIISRAKESGCEAQLVEEVRIQKEGLRQ